MPTTWCFVFSVGGGNAEKNISANIVEALKLAKSAGARVIGVVGRDGGYTKAGRGRLRRGPHGQSDQRSRRTPRRSRPWCGTAW